ncbi:MAG: TerB family tellurite resistance protein [Hyphomicrobiaceae bacterium]
MSIWGKLAGAAAGLALGGPIGALVGALAGHLAVDRNLASDEDSAGQKQVAFTIGVIALGAKMAKADGVVTKDEVAAFRQVFKVPPGEEKNVARIFDLAKKDTAGYEAYADQLAGLFSGEREMLQGVLDGLFHIASADGVLHPAEDAYLASVATRFGITDAEYKYTRTRFAPKDKSSPYDILGVTPDIGDEALKKHYRKLIAENHPDRAMARGMPEEFITIATEKSAAINEAYEEIARERGL